MTDGVFKMKCMYLNATVIERVEKFISCAVILNSDYTMNDLCHVVEDLWNFFGGVFVLVDFVFLWNSALIN